MVWEKQILLHSLFVLIVLNCAKILGDLLSSMQYTKFLQSSLIILLAEIEVFSMNEFKLMYMRDLQPLNI